MLHKFHEGSLEIGQGGIAIRVVVLDVGYHFDGGFETQEHAVVLIRLDDEGIAFSGPGVNTQVRQYTADNKSWFLFHAVSSQASMAVVVVLPCVPAMVMPVLPSIRLPRKSARLTTGIRAARAATTSGLSSGMAEERTTRSAPTTFFRAVTDVDGRTRRLQIACK
jgi:hypothetical protein